MNQWWFFFGEGFCAGLAVAIGVFAWSMRP